MAKTPENAIVIDGKRIVLDNKPVSKLEHFLQLARDQLRRYNEMEAHRNYSKEHQVFAARHRHNLEGNIRKILDVLPLP